MAAPIVIFAFNRSEALSKTLEALKRCPEAIESDLYVFIDGPRPNKNSDIEKVESVKNVVKSITGFRSLTIKESQENKGLGPSIIDGVTEVISQYGKVIVLEDDLIVQPNFLNFMNRGLSQYYEVKDVWSICGYTNRIKVPKNYPYDVYFAPRSSSWGWATWADRWNSVDWTFKKWDEWKRMRRSFNCWGGSDCFSMLNGCRIGKNKSWAIRFCFNQFLQNKLALFPIKSLVINDGFDGQGTNCKKYSRFKYDLMDESKVNFIFSGTIMQNKKICSQALSYNSLMIRAWSRLMYLIKR